MSEQSHVISMSESMPRFPKMEQDNEHREGYASLKHTPGKSRSRPAAEGRGGTPGPGKNDRGVDCKNNKSEHMIFQI